MKLIISYEHSLAGMASIFKSYTLSALEYVKAIKTETLKEHNSLKYVR